MAGQKCPPFVCLGLDLREAPLGIAMVWVTAKWPQTPEMWL
jgi:hypothetical protein